LLQNLIYITKSVEFKMKSIEFKMKSVALKMKSVALKMKSVEFKVKMVYIPKLTENYTYNWRFKILTQI